MESLKQLQMERDQYAENLKGESAMWQQRVQQMAEQVRPRLWCLLYLSISMVQLRRWVCRGGTGAGSTWELQRPCALGRCTH